MTCAAPIPVMSDQNPPHNRHILRPPAFALTLCCLTVLTICEEKCEYTYPLGFDCNALLELGGQRNSQGGESRRRKTCERDVSRATHEDRTTCGRRKQKRPHGAHASECMLHRSSSGRVVAQASCVLRTLTLECHSRPLRLENEMRGALRGARLDVRGAGAPCAVPRRALTRALAVP